MPNIYKVLDTIITEYIGVDDETYEILDGDLYKCLTNECELYIKQVLTIDQLSKEATICINQWEEQLRDMPLNSPRDEASWREL